MKPKQLLGMFLLASPFIGIGVLSFFLVGLAPTIAIFALTILIVLVIATGVYLVEDVK